MAAPTNFLAAEPAIIARVTEKVPSLVKVMSAMELAQAKEFAQFAPAVFVVFGGLRVLASADNPLLVRGVQEWSTWLMVRNVSSGRQAEAARAEAGPMLTLLIDNLHGWRPIPEGQQLRLVSAPAPVMPRTKDDKFAGGVLFPLVFDLPIPI